MDNKKENQLQELMDQINAQIVVLNDSVTKTKEKINTIEEYYTNFEKIRGEIEANNEQVRSILDSSTQSKSDIDVLKGAAEESLKQIRTDLENVSANIRAMTTAYDEFQEIKNKIDDPSVGLQITFNLAKKLKEEIDVLKEKSNTFLNQITNNLSTIDDNVQEMIQEYASFQEINLKIKDPSTGLNALLGVATSLKDEIAKTKSGIDETYREILNIRKHSESLKKSIEDDKKTIEEYKITSEEYKSQIGTTLALVTDSSLANSFKERKSELMKESFYWLGQLFFWLFLQ